MKTYDVLVRTDIGELSASFEAQPDIPTGLLLQAVMSHQQLVPHLVNLKANGATALAVVHPSRLTLPPGLTIVFPDGVNINGPIKPSPVPNVPPQFDGVQLTSHLAALVVYKVDSEPEDNLDDTDFEPYDTAY